MRSLLAFLLLFAACSSSDGTDTALSQVPGGPSAPPPTNGGGGGSGGGGTPAPSLFNDNAIPLGTPGGFPSDLIATPSGALITVDDAAIPANVVAYDTAGTQLYSVAIKASHLVDMDGTSPARAPTTFGTGLFGAFTGDLELCFGRWLLVTVGAGNSASTDGNGDPLSLANLVLIDTQSRQVVQTVNLAWFKQFNGQLSTGSSHDGVPQSLPVMARFVPARNGTQTGKIYVALSNGAGSSAGLGTFYNGTVQVWNANFTQSQPLSIEAGGKASTDITRVYVSDHYNPVGLTGYQAARGVSFILLTFAGASLLDSNFTAHPTTDAYLEFLDLDTQQWRPDWAVNLGAVLPATQEIALGTDQNGVHYGLLTSQTFAAAYVVELTGLESNPVDTAALRLVRSVELGPSGAGGAYLPGVALSGGTAVVTSFTTSSVLLLDVPGDIEFGTFLKSADLPATGAFGLGQVVITGNDAWVVVNGDFDAMFAPRNPARIGRVMSLP